MNLFWLVRAARWARHPPSAGRVMLVLGVIVAALMIFGAEHFGFWPDWAQVEPQGRRPHFALPPSAQP